MLQFKSESSLGAAGADLSGPSGYAVKHRERAEALKRAAAGTRRRSVAASLASHLAQQPASYDGRKIAAVDKSIEALDVLPERYASVKTLYLSKNALRSLAGVEQFRELKALSAADNLLADLDCLHALPAAGIALEAASFEGNPLADLPNYRAHVIHILGPSLGVLDNRTVTPEERSAAAGAVAHEATVLSLMLSNACLVHKLGRAVQLVRLHCELQCAVLSGQYGRGGGCGGGHGGGLSADDGSVLCSGRGINRVLQLWDYEGSLGRQERHAISLAIRREVGRRYRKILAAGGRPEGSSKLWQQAFAQVMLLQQETIASLMGMLEEAKAEAAANLAPLTRPPSPTKRAALESEAEAQGRLRQDREALIQELRDAFMGLAESSADANAPQRAAELEVRIRELHAALEAAGDSPVLGSPSGSQGPWAIPAVRLSAPASTPASPRAAVSPTQQQRRVGSSVLKSALKKQRPASGCGWSPARPGAHAGAGPAGGLPRPASAASGAAALGAQTASQPRPGTAPSSAWQQQGGQQHGGQRLDLEQQAWQADDGLLEYEAMEQARCKTPRPFQAGSEAVSPSREVNRPLGLPPPNQWAGSGSQAGMVAAQQQQQQHGSGQPVGLLPRPASAARAGSPPRSRPGSPGRPQSGSPSEWTPNPLARTSTNGTGGKSSPGAESPRQGLQAVFRLLEREGRPNHIEALKSAVAQYETTAAELQAGNHELAQALQQVQQHAQALEAQMAAQRQAAEERQAAAEAELAAVWCAAKEQQAEAESQLAELRKEVAAQQEGADVAQRQQVQQLEELGRKLEEAMAARQALQAQLEAAAEQQQALLKAAVVEREAAAVEQERQRACAAAREQQLVGRVAELEARRSVHLYLRVQYEEEWRAEAARAAALEARAAELSSRMAAYELQKQREAACARLATRAVLRRVLLRWREAAAQHAYLGAMQHHAEAVHRRSLLSTWLSAWRLATHRSRLLAALEAQRQYRSVQTAWQAWRVYCQDCILQRGLDAAAGLQRQRALLQQSFAAWHGAVVARRQVELPGSHPTMRVAAQLQRRRLLRTFFVTWRQHMSEVVLPRMAAVQLRLLEHFMGSQRRAFAAWQHYLEQRREGRLLKAASQTHYQRRLLLHWRQAAQESKKERTSTLRAAFTSQQLLLRRGWRAWQQAVQEKRQLVQGRALAEQLHRRKLLVRCWARWQEWTALCRGMGQRHAARLQSQAFRAWHLAAKAAEKKRLADAYDQHRRLRRFRTCLRAWRDAAAARRARRHQLAHVQAVLRRRLLGRVVSGWRRAALAGKLFQALDVVHHLQSAVERAREELEHKTEEIEALNSVRVTVEGTSESLQVQVSSLDDDLAAALLQAAELQAAAQAAQKEHEVAVTALQEALTAQKAAEAKSAAAAAARDQAVAARGEAQAEQAAAQRARQAAELQAAEAEARAKAAAASAAAATSRADTAAAAIEELRDERQVLAAQLAATREAAERATARLEKLEDERERLRAEREQAEQAAVAAAADKQAALKQAERLSEMCKEQQQQCRRLQQRVAELQGSVVSQAALQADVEQLATSRNQLQADNQSMQAQLDRFAAAVQRAEGDNASLQKAAEAAAAEQQRLQERCRAAEAEADRLVRLTDSMRSVQSTLEEQLDRAQAEAVQAAGKQRELTAAVEALTGERDGLAAKVAAQEAQWGEERAQLEAAAEQLRGQLMASNEVLESCRRMLGETCSARTAANQQAASLTEMLRSLKAELLLKDASIKALSRENTQRAERLRALQAQVAALSQEAAGAQPPDQQLYTATGASSRGPPAAMRPASAGWAAGSGRSAGFPPVPDTARAGSPAAGQRVAARQADTFATSGPAQGSQHLWGSASGMATGAAAPPSPRAGVTTSTAAGGYQTPQQFSFASPAPSYMALPAQQAWQHSAAAAAGPASSTPTSTGTDRSSRLAAAAAAVQAGSPTGSGSSGSTATNSVSGSASSHAQRLAPVRGSAVSSTPASSSRPAPSLALHLPLHLPADGVLCDQQLSYLMELVVAKRISAAQAQQVINAAAGGDTQPLLRMLSAVQRQIEQAGSSCGSSGGSTSSAPHAVGRATAAGAAGLAELGAAGVGEERQVLQVTVEQRRVPGRPASP